MTWTENIARWRTLSQEAKLRVRWEAIPADVAETMAFEREAVSLEQIRGRKAAASAAHMVPQHMREYALKLRTRWEEASEAV